MSQVFEPPAPEALAHSDALAARIRSAIAAQGGWLDFADYMRMALYEPALGYYSGGSAKFGSAGDFVTAPEVSPLFARCLARAMVPVLATVEDPVVLELGAGSGALAGDLLPALEALGCTPSRYLVLEVSAELRERQRARLAALPPALARRIAWLDSLPDAPVNGVILANEVADALPVTRFRRTAGGARALGVVVGGDGRFAWREAPAPAALGDAVAAIERDLGAPLADGYASEISLALPAWIGSLADALGRGALVLSDYGCPRREYYHPDRRDGTLICHWRHRAHADVFHLPGLQDITAWVDFSLLASSAVAAGLVLEGYTTQAHFLMDNGLDRELSAWAGRQDAAAMRVMQQAKTLLLPGEMGERFKVAAFTRGDVRVPGFRFRDLSDRL